MNHENLGPAERIIQTLLAYQDHMIHNRPGIVSRDASAVVGAKWQPVTHKEEAGERVVYQLDKVGKKTQKARLGVLQPDGNVTSNRVVLGRYQPAGIFPEVAVWMYTQVAEVWKLDNEFAARWASYAFGQEHRDLKVVLASFMLVQSRRGDPVLDAGKVAFFDEDFRDVGEAMLLLQRKDNKDFNPKLLLRVHDLLSVPEIAAVNRALGFGKSARRPFYGRWEKAVEKWLIYREENEKLLAGLVKAGFRSSVMTLARRVGYKPQSPKFFQTLRWKQAQSEDGRRSIAIGLATLAAESWEDNTEEQICQIIVRDRPGWKRIVGLVPARLGITRAIMTAAIEANALSNKDLVIATPTIEELGLLEVQDIKDRWNKAVQTAEDMRAANIALRVKSKETKEALGAGADIALQKAVAEVMRDIRIYFMVDASASMERGIEQAKAHMARFVQAFPPDRLHASVFNTQGRVVEIKHASAAGVENAFRGIRAGGGTDYGAGIRALQHLKPLPGEDVVFLFVGDEEAPPFSEAVRRSGLAPVAFGFVKVGGTPGHAAVTSTAAALGIPCFQIDERTFADPYAIPRQVRALIAATPVGQAPVGGNAPRVSLAEMILKTEILKKPAWAS